MTGAQGFQGGSTFVPGAQGASGAQGSQGAKGPQGAQGIKGPQGAKGPQGFQGATGAPGPSDERLKKNIQPIESPLETVLKLRGVEYFFKNPQHNNVDGYKDIGFIAQELLPYVPEVVYKGANDFYGVRYSEMIALCIEAIKEQEKKVEDLGVRAERILNKAQQSGLLV